MSDGPPCPYCRVPIEAVGARCAACGLAATSSAAPDARWWPPPVPPPPAWSTPPPPRPRSSSHIALVIALVVVLGLVASCSVVAVAAIILRGSTPDRSVGSTANRFPGDELISDRPLLHGDTVFVFGERSVGAFDRATLEPRWWAPVCELGQWADVTRQTADDVLVVHCDGELVGVASDDGERLWTAHLDEEPDYVRSTSSTLVLGFEDRVTVRDLVTGLPRWEKTGLGPGGHPVAVDRERVYVADGQTLDAYDAGDGRALWHADVDVGVMTVDGSTLYVREFLHRVVAVDTATGATQWASPGAFDSLTHTVILGVTAGHLVFRSDSAVIGFSLTKQSIAWRAPLGDGFAAAGSVVTVSEDGLTVTDVLRGVPMENDPTVFTPFSPAFDADGIVYVDDYGLHQRHLPR